MFHWYGIIMAVAVVVGVWIFSRQLAQRGIDAGHALGIAVIAVPCGIIGARLFSVVDNFGYYWHNPGKIFGLGLVGLAIYGVLAGGIFGLVVYCRWKKLPLLRVLDSTALAFPVAQIIGRCANIINGDTWGPPTKLPWGFTYTNPHAFLPANLLGVPTHPTPDLRADLAARDDGGALLLLIPRLQGRRHGLLRLPRAVLAGALLHLVLPGEQHHLPGDAGGAAPRRGRHRPRPDGHIPPVAQAAA